jgi:peroxin-2
MTTTTWQKFNAADELSAIESQLSSNGGGAPRSIRVLRVHQLDSSLFDAEIWTLLRGQLSRVLDNFSPSSVSKWRPEIDAALGLAMFSLGICSRNASTGHTLQNLVFRDEIGHRKLLAGRSTRSERAFPKPRAWQLALFAIGTVVVPYFLTRVRRMAARQGWADMPEGTARARVWQAMRGAERLYRVAVALNFVIFMVDGRYMTLLARLLSLRLVYASVGRARYLNFEYMNQQLVWNGLTELLMFLAPLVKPRQIAAAAKRWLRRDASESAADDAASSSSLLSASSPLDACVICSARPMNTPYATSCGHCFCYFCIRATSVQHNEQQFPCPTCSASITSLKRVYLGKSS